MDSINWPATAGMLTVIALVSSGIGALIAALVVKPLIDRAVKGLVSRELFNAFVERDSREHQTLQHQMDAVYERLNR